MFDFDFGLGEDIDLLRESETGDGVAPSRVPVAEASSSLFTVLRMRPLHGRLFSAEDDQSDGQSVVILGHGFWQRRFAGVAERARGFLEGR